MWVKVGLLSPPRLRSALNLDPWACLQCFPFSLDFWATLDENISDCKCLTGREWLLFIWSFCTCHAALVSPHSLSAFNVKGKCSLWGSTEVSLPVALYSVLDATCSYYWSPRLSESISCPLKTLSIVELARVGCFYCLCRCVCVWWAAKASWFITVTGRDVRGLILFSYFLSVQWR